MKNKAQKEAIEALQQFCQSNKIRLSDIKKWVFDIVISTDKPIGAYDVLNALAQKVENPKPPTVYRALDFLQQHGFIHRIESLNTYISCHIDHIHEGSQFMICDQCHSVTEAHLCHLPEEINQKLHDQSFSLSFWSIELHGTCASCKKSQ